MHGYLNKLHEFFNKKILKSQMRDRRLIYRNTDWSETSLISLIYHIEREELFIIKKIIKKRKCRVYEII